MIVIMPCVLIPAIFCCLPPDIIPQGGVVSEFRSSYELVYGPHSSVLAQGVVTTALLLAGQNRGLAACQERRQSNALTHQWRPQWLL